MNRLLLASPVGPLFAEYDDDGVYALRYWPQAEQPPAGTREAPAPDDALGRELTRQLAEYFAGERRDFNLPLAAQGTAFQQRVWAALRGIPFGETRTYAQIAEEAGSPGGAIAVGQANARNPISLMVPCHRVVGATSLGGYAGSAVGEGVETKRWLLRHEAAI